MAVRNRWRPFFFGGVELIPGNRLRLLQSGADFFPALIAAIDSAQHEVHLETYIFNPDTSAEAVQAALIRAAQRGVLVRLMIDAVGSRLLPADWLDRMRAAGIRLLVYRPLRAGRLSSPHNLRRLHRKLAVIDARIAFIGGMNLLDDFEPVRFAAPRLDFSVEIQGPLLASIHPSVRRLWQLVMLTQLRSGEQATWAEPSWPTDGHVRAAYVVRDNFAHRRDIERVYLVALARARKQVVLASAYFLPGHRFRKLLKNAVARGVRVQLLVQGHTDHPFYQAAARALYRDLLLAGIEIYEYQASELHAKVAVIDGHWATVGSSNIDPFSLLMAREANIVVDDAGFALDLQQRLQQAIIQSTPLDIADWQRRPWPQRMLSRLAYGLVRFGLGLAGFGRWV